jgi:hypothetical protein
MPMRWPVNKAATYIATRLDKRPLEIAFPGPFIAVLRLLAALPHACNWPWANAWRVLTQKNLHENSHHR